MLSKHELLSSTTLCSASLCLRSKPTTFAEIKAASSDPLFQREDCPEQLHALEMVS